MSKPRRWLEYGECEWVEAEAYDAAKNRIKYLEAQLAEANAVAEYYSQDRNWHRRFAYACDVDDEDLHWSKDRVMDIGGKRARQYLEKWKVGSEEAKKS